MTSDGEADLKLLHQRVFAEQRALRTKHEFRAMMQLRHPRMVEVRDYGFLPSGAPFFVMELLEGRDLAGAVGLSLPTIYRIVAGVADALGFMHARGYVHRDIKPANVLLRTQTNGTPDVKLLDFGTVELTGGGAGTIAGTMRYLAPESHYGAAADPRVDLYALGVLAYELCTGAYPFAGGVAAELLEAKLAGLPPLDQVRADVPAPFARLVEDLLAPEPSARPRSCQEVSARLAGLSAGLDTGFELGRELHTPALLRLHARRLLGRVALVQGQHKEALEALSFSLSDRPGVVRPSSDDPLAPTVDGSVPTRLAARGTPVSTPAASAGVGKPAPSDALAATVDDVTPGRRA